MIVIKPNKLSLILIKRLIRWFELFRFSLIKVLAVSKGDIKQWKKLMENKVNFLTKNYTWDLVDRLKNRAVLTGK